MNILIQPMYSKQELNADSNYIIYTQWVKAISKLRPDWHFVIIFPDKESGFKYFNDGFFNSTRVTRIPQRISTRKQANAISYDQLWYDALFRKFAFDAIWCNLVEVGAHLKYSGESSYVDNGRQCVINAHNYVIHKTLPYPIEAQRNVLVSQLMGSICADANVFNSNHCKNMFFDNCREYLSSEVIKEIEEKSYRIDYGPLDEKIFCKRELPKNEVPLIAYNHRLQGYKQWRETFRILHDLWEGGLKFRLRYMNNTAENTAHIKKYPWVEIRLCKDRGEYIANLSQCDINITNSVHETFCISAIESMAMGQPLIAPNGITFPQITGAADGNKYPMLFDSESNQKEIIRRAILDEDWRNKWGAVVRDHVKRYSHDLWAERYSQLIANETNKRMEFEIKQEIEEETKKIISEAGRIELRDLYNKMTKIKVDGKQSISNQSYPLVKILRLSRKIGAKSEIIGGKQWILF